MSSARRAGETLIKRGQQMISHIVAGAVRVPVVSGHGIVMHRDEARACLDEATRHETALTEKMPAVAVAHRFSLCADVESAAGLSGDERHGALAMQSIASPSPMSSRVRTASN